VQTVVLYDKYFRYVAVGVVFAFLVSSTRGEKV